MIQQLIQPFDRQRNHFIHSRHQAFDYFSNESSDDFGHGTYQLTQGERIGEEATRQPQWSQKTHLSVIDKV